MRSSCVPRLLLSEANVRGKHARPPTCHARPLPVIPAPHLSFPPPHLSFPQGFSGNPESFVLETLDDGGSMQPLTPALSLKGGFAKFPFSVIPAKPGPAIGDRGAGIQKKRPALPGHPKAGEWAVIPAGGSGAVRFRGPSLENFCGFPLKPAGMTDGASPAGMTEGASLAGMTEEALPAGMTEGVSPAGMTEEASPAGMTEGGTCGNDRGGITCGNDRGGVACGNDRGGVTCGNDRGGVCHQMSEGLHE